MDVGTSMNIGEENIIKYEKGLQKPKLSTIIKFVKVFDMNFNKLLVFQFLITLKSVLISNYTLRITKNYF